MLSVMVMYLPLSSFRGDAQHRTRNLEIPGLVSPRAGKGESTSCGRIIMRQTRNSFA
jgi:hypothetical protein